MIIVLAHCGNGYCGCEDEEVFFFDDGTDEESIETIMYDWALDNAESFSFGWGESYTEEEWDDYIENWMTFNWNIISHEEYLEYCDYNDIEPVE